jgi:2-dehydropantoate 2-reductase
VKHHKLPDFRIAVVGSGAIGSYYGARLAYYGRKVHFLWRSGFEEVSRRGIHIRSRKETFRVAKVQAYTAAAAIGPCDLVLIALKATDNSVLLELLPPLLHEKTALLTLQNGLGNDEFLAQHFGGERVLGGLCFICLNRISAGVIDCLHHGYVNIGEFSGYPQPRTHDIAWEFKRCGVVCTVVENLARERWRKLVWNIPFNGLSVAAGGITTEEILRQEPLRRAALGLMHEVIAGAGTCGHHLATALALEQIKRTESMGPYKPSTLLDFEAGRPLEVEAIWGEPLRRAEAGKAMMPRLAQLYALLKSLDCRQ